MSKIFKFIERLDANLNWTLTNKLIAIVMVEMGVIAAIISDGDATGLIGMLIFAAPLFCAKENWLL